MPSGAVAGSVGLAIGAMAVFAWRRSWDETIDRRLRRVAAPLAAPAAGAVQSAGVESIFRPREGGARLAWMWRPIERRYPLVHPLKALALALLAGALAAAFAAFSLWFLKVPAGWWTLPIVAGAGAYGAWAGLGWQQARREAGVHPPVSRGRRPGRAPRGRGRPAGGGDRGGRGGCAGARAPAAEERVRRAARGSRRGPRAAHGVRAGAARGVHALCRGAQAPAPRGRGHLRRLREPLGDAARAEQGRAQDARLDRADPPHPAGCSR